MFYKETAVDKAQKKVSGLLYDYPIDFTGDPENNMKAKENIELYSYIMNVVLMDIDAAMYHGMKIKEPLAEQGINLLRQSLENNLLHIKDILDYTIK